MASGVYTIRCRPNGRQYIGSTIHTEDRWRQHVGDLKESKHFNHHLQRAWDKYGEEAFEFTILEICKDDVLLEHEQFHIDSHSFRSLFNTNPVAAKPPHMSDWTDEQQAAHSERTRETLRKRNVNPEHQAKMRAGYLANPENAEAARKRIIKLNQDPKHEKKRLAGLKAYWGNPEKKAAHLKKMEDGRKRKK